ncbi:MAG: VOC family protein [Lautropia sp.]
MPKAIDIAHVVYECTDLDRMQVFLEDFGMLTGRRDAGQLVMRGAGPSPVLHVTRHGSANRFVGAALEMGSRDELDALAAMPGSSPVEPIDDLPGEGWRVRMQTPDGVAIDAIWGQRRLEPVPLREPNRYNWGTVKNRFNASLRPRREPGLVLRIGHFGLRVADHEVTRQWFRDRFGLLDSDYLCVPGDERRIVGTFVRFDAGERYVDHHCMLIAQSRDPSDTGVHHCSFEMQDLDAIFGAHDHLLKKGHALECGIGRHLVGSQIFDYWRDPFGNRIEHYTDGDVANDAYEPVRYAVYADETTQWGMDPPRAFFD